MTTLSAGPTENTHRVRRRRACCVCRAEQEEQADERFGRGNKPGCTFVIWPSRIEPASTGLHWAEGGENRPPLSPQSVCDGCAACLQSARACRPCRRLGMRDALRPSYAQIGLFPRVSVLSPRGDRPDESGSMTHTMPRAYDDSGTSHGINFTHLPHSPQWRPGLRSPPTVCCMHASPHTPEDPERHASACML